MEIMICYIVGYFIYTYRALHMGWAEDIIKNDDDYNMLTPTEGMALVKVAVVVACIFYPLLIIKEGICKLRSKSFIRIKK